MKSVFLADRLIDRRVFATPRPSDGKPSRAPLPPSSLTKKEREALDVMAEALKQLPPKSAVEALKAAGVSLPAMKYLLRVLVDTGGQMGRGAARPPTVE